MNKFRNLINEEIKSQYLCHNSDNLQKKSKNAFVNVF